MGILEELRKLDEQRAKLLEGAKTEALQKAEAAVAELNQLGFNYRLVSGSGSSRTPSAPSGGGTRRTGIREQILQIVTDHPNGIKTTDIRESIGAEGKSGAQSVANAIAALAKEGKIASVERGMYKPA